MNEEKSNGSRTAILVALIGSLSLGSIITALIQKCDLSPNIETTSQPTQETDNAGAHLTKPTKPISAGEPKPSVAVPPKPRPDEVITGTKLLFRGQVVDKNGQSVSGVEVVCTDCEASGQKTFTDENGNFSLPFPLERKHDIQQIHLYLSKDGRSVNHYASVGELAEITFPIE